MFSSGLRFAPLEEAWSDTGLKVSPAFENPYKTEPSVIGDVDRRDIAHKYISDLYDSKGVKGVVRLLEPEVVRDIQALHQRASKPEIVLSVEEMFFIGIAILLFMYVSSD